MAESDAEYRAASDLMLETLGHLRQIEEAKRGVSVGTPEFVRLAREAMTLSLRVSDWAWFQASLASESPSARERGDISGRPIEELSSEQRDRVRVERRQADLILRNLSRGRADDPKAAPAPDRTAGR